MKWSSWSEIEEVSLLSILSFQKKLTCFNHSHLEVNHMNRDEELRKIKQAVREGVVDYTCPNCGSMIRGEPDARRLWCPTCEKHVKVTPVV